MGVYIKGIEMPTTYPLTVTIYPDGQVLSETVGAKDKHGIAVPVPPHGRLGDLDKIENEIAQLSPEGYTTGMIRLILDSAPTIIQASEEEMK